MIVSIDVDGIIVDAIKCTTKLGEEYFGKKIVEPEAWGIGEMFNVSEEEAEAYWEVNDDRYYYEVEVFPGASEFLAQLDCEFYFLTARPEKYRKITEETLAPVLKESGTESLCKGLIMRSDKAKACEELGIDVHIDDDVKQLRAVAETCPVIKLNYKYNDIEGENIYGADSYDEILAILKNELSPAIEAKALATEAEE